MGGLNLSKNSVSHCVALDFQSHEHPHKIHSCEHFCTNSLSQTPTVTHLHLDNILWIYQNINISPTCWLLNITKYLMAKK
jgi:hypothetical protein